MDADPSPLANADALPLAGVRVVALEQAVAAPLCTRHLADAGADVVKVERTDGGDLARRYDSVVRGLSAYFVWLNRGKRSLCLDVKQPEGMAVLRAALARADVFVHNLGPGAVERLGLGYEALHPALPRLIWCGISGYGPDGPYRDRKAFDLLLQAESGVLAQTGSPEEPAKVGISVADIAAGVYGFNAVLLALMERQRSGLGRRIDVSLFDSLAEWMGAPLYHYLYGGRVLPRAGMRHNIIVPYGPYRCANGRMVLLAVQNERQWATLCREVLRRPEWIHDPRFASNAQRVVNRALLEPLIEESLADVSVEEAEARLDAADLPYGRVNDVDQVAAHPQLAERGRWREAATPAGAVKALLPPFNIQGIQWPMGAVPDVGEHTDEVLAELGYDGDQIQRLRAAGAVA